MITFFMMLHNTKVCAVPHRTVVVNGLVFVMGSVDVVCEVLTELLGVIYEVKRPLILCSYLTIHLSVCDLTSTTKQCVVFS
jgi:hypothetical protein